jgi:hypothetical protein
VNHRTIPALPVRDLDDAGASASARIAASPSCLDDGFVRARIRELALAPAGNLVRVWLREPALTIDKET